MALISRPEEAVEMLAQVLEESDIPLGYVGKYDERRLPNYPAVVVSPGARDKELHATQTFAVGIRCYLYVYHAKLDNSHANRSLEDLQLCSSIEDLLEQDYTFKDENGEERVIFAYIENEAPGVFQPRAAKGDSVVGTRMTWYASSQRRF